MKEQEEKARERLMFIVKGAQATYPFIMNANLDENTIRVEFNNIENTPYADAKTCDEIVEKFIMTLLPTITKEGVGLMVYFDFMLYL